MWKILALGCFAGFVFGCGRGEVMAPPPSVYDADENAPYGTGGLVVKVVGGERYEPEANADISLYASMADYDADVYLGRIVTGKNGRADFGYLNAGNYYIYVWKGADGQEYKSLQAAQVQLGRNLTRTIVLR